MKSFTTRDFWKAYKKLPQNVQKEVAATYELWKRDSRYPSLHFKKVKANVWSVRITSDYRALAIKKGDDYYWIWVGLHSEYDRLLK